MNDHQRPQSNVNLLQSNNLLHKPSPTQETQVNNHYVKINHQTNNPKPQNVRNQVGNFDNPDSQRVNHNNPDSQRVNLNQNPFKNQHHGHHHHHNNPPRQQINENPNSQVSHQNQFHHQNVNSVTPNIIEIQQIPEVYSTDLPIITVNNQNRFKPSKGSEVLTHELPEILDKPTRGQPLLVDIQPSQVANVVIPHGSSSILVFGGVHKAHKAGQYFNDPSPHGDAEFGIKSVNLLADIDGSKYQGTHQAHNLGPQVHYDLKDNIIVASDNIPVPVPASNAPGVNILIGNSIQPTMSRPPHGFLHHSVDVVPNTVIRFHPDSNENYNRPTTQQLINQQKQQQLHIDQQLKQKQVENQKRFEIENQKRHEFEAKKRQELEAQKRLELEKQKRVDFEQQKRAEFEQQKRQEFDNQKRLEFENQKRQEIENKKRQDIIESQKRQEFLHQKMVEQQKRKEIEEQNHLKQIEIDRKREFEKQKQFEFEQRQKQIEQRQQELEHQKRVSDQKKQFEHQQKLQHEQKLRQQFEHQQKQIQEMRLNQLHQQQLQQHHKQQLQHGSNYNVRPNILPQHRPSVQQELQKNQQDSGFIILTSDYGQHNAGNQQVKQQGPFVPLSSQPDRKPEDMENETDGDGQAVQESIIRPKLPSGQAHESLEDDDVKVVEEYDNFVYHKITGLNPTTTKAPATSATTTEKPITSTPATTRRSSYVPISTERFNPTTERNQPIYKPKPYPNLQFDNLPKSVNDLQPTIRPNQNKFQRVPTINNQFRPNYNGQTGNTLSQSMQPPAPPKISRRPTSPFHKTTFKISMPINPMPDDSNVSSNLQTEEPFDPRYTEDYTTKPSLTTKVSSEKVTEVITTAKPTEAPSKAPTTTTTSSDLNIGEVEGNKTDENSDIFDSKETVNLGFVNHHSEKDDMDLMPPSIRKPYQTIVRLPESTTYSSTGVRLEVSSTELENMKPPAPAFKPPKTNAPQFEDIVNMKPPAASNELDGPRVKPPYLNIQRPTISSKRFTTPSSYVTLNRSRTTATTGSTANSRFTTKKPERESNTFDVVLKFKQGEKKEVEKNDDDVIIGSVEAIDHVPTIRSSINATPVLNTDKTSQITTTPLSRPAFTLTANGRNPSSFTRSRAPATASSDDKNFAQNRTKSFIDPIKVSTKYITNTKTITLAKTKTEVINRSHGVPYTTTRVQTETVFETITETETLLKPTLITSIHPTATFGQSIIKATAISSTTEEIVEGFVSDEDIEEFIINYDDNQNGTTINRVNSGEQPPVDNESIFVVMTDKKQGGVFNIDPSIINPPLRNHSIDNEIEDVSRGEEDINDGADHILLGGILIASPPQLNKSQQGATVSSHCLPECKSTKNEYCQRVLSVMRCICRPGFARMFPDRPCKRELRLLFNVLSFSFNS